MQYLIDGYNLLHALGRLQTRTGLEKARLRLLALLHAAFGNESGHITVVFDAARPPAGATEVQDYRGIQVRFAVCQDQADDLIELIIKRDSTPRQLTIVSDDHRLQKAGRRRHCPVMGCAEFLEWLDKRRRQTARPQVPQTPAKPEGISREEAEHWLREFADLENESDFREAFNPFDFDEKN